MGNREMIGTTGTLQVQTFVRFVLTYNEVEMNEESIRSDMLTKLLVYFLCNRNKVITAQELIDTLWMDDESDNPAGALKNLIYRLRVFIKKVWGETEFIKTERGGYRWSGDVPVVLDAEEFEKVAKKALSEKDAKKKLQYSIEASDKYSGNFLPTLAEEFWISTMTTYYHSLYIDVTKLAVELLEETEEYQKAEEILSAALLLENLDEDLHTAMIRVLVKQEKYSMAKKQYENAEEVLYENLGVRPSAQLRETYEEIHKRVNVVEENIGIIQQELDVEEDVEGGTFYCDYGVFRKAYQLEKRRMRRSSATSYVVLVSLEPRVKIKKDTQAYLNVMQRGMDSMKNALLNSLREGDVVAKYSGVQYIMLLSNCSEKFLDKIEERIQKRYYKEDKLRKVELQFSINEV